MDYSSKFGDHSIVRNNLEMISIKVIHIYVVDINAPIENIEGLNMIEANEALAELESLKWVRISATIQMHNVEEHDPNYRPNILLERQIDGTLSPLSNPDASISSPIKVILGVSKHS